MAKPIFKRPRGTQDVLPEAASQWRAIWQIFEKICLDAGYGRIMTPTFEQTNLFVRSVGDDTEIVSKEMYNFTDRSDNPLTLKPESTAGVARAYIENGLANQTKPVKLYYYEPIFRYERPQAGRLREHHQLGVEVFGAKEAYAEAQIIALAVRFFKALNLTFELQINSIGDGSTRKKYNKELFKFYESRQDKLNETASSQLMRNPMRILDSKEPAMVKLNQDAPQILDYLGSEARREFEEVLEYLDKLGIEYDLNPRLVRGLDYYNKTVFEFKGSQTGAQDSLGGGGRYDGLVETLGGKTSAAVGFGLGIERIVGELAKSPSAKTPLTKTQVYIVSISDEARNQAIILTEQLLDAGLAVRYETQKASMSEQLSKANQLNADYCLILGKKEIIDQTVIVKDMASGNQETVPLAKIATEIVKRYTRA